MNETTKNGLLVKLSGIVTGDCQGCPMSHNGACHGEQKDGKENWSCKILGGNEKLHFQQQLSGLNIHVENVGLRYGVLMEGDLVVMPNEFYFGVELLREARRVMKLVCKTREEALGYRREWDNLIINGDINAINEMPVVYLRRFGEDASNMLTTFQKWCRQIAERCREKYDNSEGDNMFELPNELSRIIEEMDNGKAATWLADMIAGNTVADGHKIESRAILELIDEKRRKMKEENDRLGGVAVICRNAIVQLKKDIVKILESLPCELWGKDVKSPAIRRTVEEARAELESMETLRVNGIKGPYDASRILTESRTFEKIKIIIGGPQTVMSAAEVVDDVEEMFRDAELFLQIKMLFSRMKPENIPGRVRKFLAMEKKVKEAKKEEEKPKVKKGGKKEAASGKKSVKKKKVRPLRNPGRPVVPPRKKSGGGRRGIE